MPRRFHVRDPERRDRRVFLATPSYSGVSSPFTYSLLHSLSALRGSGWTADWFHLEGNCHVDDARNYIVRAFLETDYTDLVFLDADVGWQPDDLVKLLAFDRDVVAGIYPKKRDDADYPAQLVPGENWSDQDGLLEAMRLPTGFLRISRNAIQTLYDQEPRKFIGTNDPDGSLPQAIIFERTYKDGRRISGDYSASDKLRAAGFKLYVDPEMRFTHQGMNEWGGCYGDWLRKKAGLNHYHAQKLVEAIRKGEADDIALFVNMVEEYGNSAFSATPELLYALYLAALNAKGTMIETGSGLSTLVLAAVSEVTGNPLITLEHDKGWILETRKLIHAVGLAHEPSFAPLKDYGDFTWYGADDLEGDFALVLCDGPQKIHGRDGLFRLYGDRMSKAMVFIDDFESEAAMDWLKGQDCKVLGRSRKFGVVVNGA